MSNRLLRGNTLAEAPLAEAAGSHLGSGVWEVSLFKFVR
jgi:hypothetical protein